MNAARALMFAALLASSAFAVTPADLIAQLGGDDWSLRQAAEDALVAQGPAVIDDLSAAMKATSDAELHVRLGSAIARINREQLTSATLVTMEKTFDRPIDALRAVANVAGLSVGVDNDAAKPMIESPKAVHISCQNTPLIEALLDVAADSGVAVRLSGEKVVVLAKPALEGRPLMAVNGALALVADSSRRSESLDLASGRRYSGTYASLTLFTEPKLRLAPGSVTIAIKTMVDEHGRPLQLRPVKLGFAHLPDGRWSCMLGLPPLDPPSAKIATLDLELFANVVVQTSDLHVDDLSTLPAELNTPSGIVGIKSVSQTAGNWTIVLHTPQATPRFNGVSPMLQQIFQIADPDMLNITDSHGRHLGTGMPQLTQSQDPEVTIPITLASPDDPPKMVQIRLPSQTRELRLPLSLHDLPLP